MLIDDWTDIKLRVIKLKSGPCPFLSWKTMISVSRVYFYLVIPNYLLLQKKQKIKIINIINTQFRIVLALISSFLWRSLPTPLANSFTKNWVWRYSSLVRWGLTIEKEIDNQKFVVIYNILVHLAEIKEVVMTLTNVQV